MDRMQERTTREEAETHELPAAAEMAECESCGNAADALTFLEGWNFFACADCVRECDKQDLEAEWEKECTCRQTDVDVWNNRGCVVHDRRAA